MDGFILSKASDIKLGNNQINTLQLGNNQLWDINGSTKEWVLRPIVMMSTAYIRNSFNTVLTDQVEIMATGNTSFIMKPINDIKLSDVEISYPYDSFNRGRPRCHFLKLDDFALYIHRFYGWNVWRGGTGSAIWDETTTLKYFGQSKTVKLRGYTDENNKTYINGLYVSKVIKSPSCGSTGVVKISFFPYTFYDEFYAMQTFDLWMIDYTDTNNNPTVNGWKKKYLWDNINKVFVHATDGTVIPLSDTMFSSFNVTYEGLKGKIEYTTKPNYTNKFRDIALCTNDAMVHFIQEPHNDHRIYIGEYADHTYLTGTSQYIDEPQFPEEYLFHICGSKIINRDIEFLNDYKKFIMYPTSLEAEYNISMIGQIDYIGTYTWDNLTYKHYRFYKGAKIKFKKK